MKDIKISDKSGIITTVCEVIIKEPLMMITLKKGHRGHTSTLIQHPNQLIIAHATLITFLFGLLVAVRTNHYSVSNVLKMGLVFRTFIANNLQNELVQLLL